MKKIIILLTILAGITSCSDNKVKMPEKYKPQVNETQEAKKGKLVDGSQLGKLMESGDPILIDFNATWCGPCKMMKPIVEELAAEYEGKVTFVSLDTDKYPQYAQQFGVTSIPMFVVYEKGEVQWGSEGTLPKQMLEEPLKKYK
ncbi:MAG: thioredoxin [Flavobacteriales bacterium]